MPSGMVAMWPRMSCAARTEISPIAAVDSLHSVTVEQLGQPPLADLQRCRLRLDIADALIGDADVRAR